MEDLYLRRIEQYIARDGFVTFHKGDISLTLDLKNKHERAYAAKLFLDVRYPQSDLDSLLFKRFIRKMDKVLDAGANIGFTSIEITQMNAKLVVAVEPVPALFARLNQIKCQSIIKVNAALGAKEGWVDVVISQQHNQGSTYNHLMIEIFPDIFGEKLETVHTKLTTIDKLSGQFGPFDVWKIDVEGAEIDVLRGAEGTLRKTPPRIIIAEIYDQFRDEFMELIKATHPYQYRVFINTATYNLEFVDALTEASPEYYVTSPMYVFARTSIFGSDYEIRF